MRAVERIAFAWASFVAASASAEALRIEPGLWEVTYNYSLQGPPPASVLAALPPEKRAAIEKGWTARAGQRKTNVAKTCVTAEELAKGTEFENDGEAAANGCERTLGTQTATRWTLAEHCTSATGPSERHVQISTTNPHVVEGSMNASKGEAGANSGIDMKFSGKWIAKSCGDVR